MLASSYMKMAETSAVFFSSNYDGASWVERDGMVWTASELHLEQISPERQHKPPMPNALEGREDYDKPEDGDVRLVESMGVEFVYSQRIQGWVQLV